MAFRFRKTLTVFPGFRVNLSKSGASVSVGPRGLSYTVGPKGARVTAGIPGTGLSVTHFTPYGRPASPSDAQNPVADFQPQQFTPLQPIESAPAHKINELSTSEFVPILNAAHSRRRFAPFVLALSLLTFAFAIVSKNQLLIGSAALLAAIFLPFVVFLDRYRTSVKIVYEPTETLRKIAGAIEESFADLKSCHYVWNISAQGNTSDWKRNAGATKTLNLERVYPTSKRPSCIRGSVSFPSCAVGREELYFLPDVLLVITPTSVAALQYKDFSTSLNQVRFIEEGPVPRDTSVVGQTWRYVNRDGGPDRRFGSNKQLPICLYGELSFTSPGGLNEILQISNPSAGERFANVCGILQGFDLPISEAKSIKSFRPASRLPSLIFWLLLLVAALPLSALTLAEIQSAHDQSAASNAAPPAPAPSPAQRPSSPANSRNNHGAPSQSHPPAQRLETVPMPRPRPTP